MQMKDLRYIPMWTKEEYRRVIYRIIGSIQLLSVHILLFTYWSSSICAKVSVIR